MEKIDARKLGPKTQYENRKQIIRLRKQGIPNKVVAEGLGITERHASKIWQTYLKEGDASIKSVYAAVGKEKNAYLRQSGKKS